jgi:hypothetical protein
MSKHARIFTESLKKDPEFLLEMKGDKREFMGTIHKPQLSQWKSPSSPCLTNARQVHTNVKSMFIIFFLLSRNCAL